MAQESAWIRICAKHKAKHRLPKTGGNVTSPGEEKAVIFSRPSHKNREMNSITDRDYPMQVLNNKFSFPVLSTFPSRIQFFF